MSALQIVSVVGGVVGVLSAMIGSSACFYHLNTTSKSSLLILERKAKELKELLESIQQNMNEKGVLRPDPLKWNEEDWNEIRVARPDIGKWIADAIAILDSSGNMNLGARLHNSCANACIPNVCGLCETWKLIEKNIGEMDKLLTEGKEYKVIGFKKSLEAKNIIGEDFKNTSEIIWNELLSPEDGVQVVCIHGMAGVGKTLMASAIHDRALENLKDYEHVLWVGIKHNSSIKDIQEDIAKQLDVEISGCKDDGNRATKLQGALTSRKFFMVLDNLPMRQNFRLGDIGIPSSGNDWKLIVASRSHSACTKVRGSFEKSLSRIHEIQPLSEIEAWELFVEVSKPISVRLKDDPLYQKTKRVIDDLDGLPSAIEMLAKALKQVHDDHHDRFSDAWNRELSSLSTSGSLLGNKSQEFYDLISHSFEYVGDDLPCLWYFLLFPTGYLKANDLIDYWMCEGLLGEKFSSLEETRGIGWVVLSKLIEVHLLKRNDHDEESVMMPNTIRLVAMNEVKSPDHKFFINCGKSLRELPLAKDWPANAAKASFVDNHVSALQNGPDCRNLTTLLLQHNLLMQNPHNKFFSKLMNLRVLDLSHTKITSLPNSLFGLKELRALLLRHCYNLNFLQSLSDLQELLVLDLSGTPLKRLPRGLSDLKNLRRLDLSQSNIGTFRAEEVSTLSKIEELLLISNQEQGKLTWGSSQIHPVWNGPSVDELAKLEKLVVLQLNFTDTAVFIRFLETSEFGKSGKKCTFCVGGYYKAGRVIGDNSLTIMHDQLMVTLPSLEKYGCFNNLTVLDVSYCDELKFVLTWEMLAQLHNLKDIRVKRCRNVESIIKPHSEAYNVGVSALTLVLYDLPRLQSICDRQVLNFLPIQKVEVWNCGILVLPQELGGGNSSVVIRGHRNWLESVRRNRPQIPNTFEFEEIFMPIELVQSPGWNPTPVIIVPEPVPPSIATLVSSLADRFICNPVRNVCGSISARFARRTEDGESPGTLRRSNSQ